MLKIQDIENSLRNASNDFQSERILDICRNVDALLKKNESLTFIDSYRKIIRNNSWNYDDSFGSSFEDLLDRWLSTHLYYIDSANEFYDYFSEGKGDFSELSQRAIISETLRGREGKRSKIGLDAFLSEYINRIDEMIQDVYSPEDKEDVLNLMVSCMSHPFMSAETELYNLFYDYSRLIGQELNYDNFISVDSDSNGLASKLLQEFCKYSFMDFNQKLDRFNFNEESFNRKKDFQTSLNKERFAVLDEIKGRIQEDSPNKIEDFENLVSRINQLNYLNANIEVKYSFKGWPGLFHHFVFKELDNFSGSDIYQKQCSAKYMEVLEKNG